MVRQNMLRFLILFILPQLVLANAWQDLWFNKNQQGSHLLKQNKNKEAAQTFTDKNWKGIAYYRDGKYQEAYDEFKQDNSAQGLYNQGNALAHLQKYEDAIKAYNKSLEIQKDSPDTIYNKELVEKLLQQQKQQQQNNQNQKQSDKNKSGQDSKEQQNNNQKNSEQNSSNKQDNQQSGQKNSGQQQNNQDKKQPDQDKSGQNSQQQQNKEQSGQKDSSSQQNNQSQSQKKQQQNSGQNTNKDRQLNSGKPETMAADKGTKPENKTENKEQPGVSNNAQPTDKNANNQAPVTNYMRPQTPTDVEVKSALSKIPDDPGGLLRNKFLRDYQQQGD